MQPRIEINRDPIPHHVDGISRKRKSPVRVNIESLKKGECLVIDYSDYNLSHTILAKKGRNIRSIVGHVKKDNPGMDFTTRFDTFNGVFRIWRIA